jgi:hypothetical protein
MPTVGRRAAPARRTLWPNGEQFPEEQDENLHSQTLSVPADQGANTAARLRTPFGRVWLPARSRVQLRPLWPPDEEFPVERDNGEHKTPSVPAGETPDDPRLQQWMAKRHGTCAGLVPGEKAVWGRRYVTIDDRRGRLNYEKKEFLGSREVAFSVPLQDVTSVRALPMFATGDPTRHQFEVQCAPHRLVLGVRDEREMNEWVGSLQSRVEHWRRKADESGQRAVPNFARDSKQPWLFSGCRPAW